MKPLNAGALTHRLTGVRWYSRDDACARVGVEPAYVDRLLDLGVLAPAEPGRLSPGDLRRVLMAKSLEDAGIPLDHVAAALRSGTLSFEFLDGTAYERFATLAGETFQEVSDRTGVPVELVMAVREAIGSAPPSPDDFLRADEMDVVPFLELQVSGSFRPSSIEHLLRVYGESTRRIAEAEGGWWNSEVVQPAIAAGKGAEAVANRELAERSTPLAERAVLGLYHAQQARAWTSNFIESFEVLMAQAGIHSRLERPPAICFLDLTGYTRLTQERGDEAAADLAAALSRLVQRGSVRFGGKPIKWLGDGVMFYYRDPGPGVRSALEMVDALASAGLPPAHVGLHTGPVLFQQGDYFGQTVNLTARIAEYARPSEVLVSQAVADVSQQDGITFHEIGAVELKGVSGTVTLLRAQLG